MIKNIIFDLGGVLLTGDDEIFFRSTKKLAELLGVNKFQLIKAWGRSWFDFRLGKITEDEFFSNYVDLYRGEKYSKNELLIKLKILWRDETRTLPAFDLLSQLRSKFNLYALTNISREWLDYKRKKYNLDNLFINIFNSPEEGVAKPNPQIYSNVLTKAKLLPEETIFVDDLPKNIFGAKSVGMQGILFKNREQLLKELKKFNIDI